MSNSIHISEPSAAASKVQIDRKQEGVSHLSPHVNGISKMDDAALQHEGTISQVRDPESTTRLEIIQAAQKDGNISSEVRDTSQTNPATDPPEVKEDNNSLSGHNGDASSRTEHTESQEQNNSIRVQGDKEMNGESEKTEMAEEGRPPPPSDENRASSTQDQIEPHEEEIVSPPPTSQTDSKKDQMEIHKDETSPAEEKKSRSRVNTAEIVTASTSTSTSSWKLLMLPTWDMALIYLFCGGMLALHFLALYKWPKGEFGMGVLRQHMDCGSHGAAFMTFGISLPMNVLCGILCLPATVFQNKKRGQRPHMVLKIAMILLSVPMHLLYNSIFFRSNSVYDAYEILVSDDFLHRNSTPFDPSMLHLLETNGKANILKTDYNMTTPYLSNVTESILHLQEALTSKQNQSAWTNITFGNCQKRYKSNTFETFSNVIVVTNYTQPADTNNSALALTILTGYAGPKHQKRQSLVSLCPKEFFPEHNLSVPTKWKYVGNKPNGLFDPYAPKKFPAKQLKQQNVFVKSCYSQEMPHTCRLLYSTLNLKIATWFLVAMIACMTLSLFWPGRLDDDLSMYDAGDRFILAVCTNSFVFVAFVIQLIVMGTSQAAKRHPFGPSDNKWLLNTFCIINVVQLFDTISDTICGVISASPMASVLYFPVAALWHWFISGVFTMVVFDRYKLSSNSTSLPLPGRVILPSADLSSLWFRSMFDWFRKTSLIPVIGVGAAIDCFLLFGGLFAIKMYATYGVYKIAEEIEDD